MESVAPKKVVIKSDDETRGYLSSHWPSMFWQVLKDCGEPQQDTQFRVTNLDTQVKKNI